MRRPVEITNQTPRQRSARDIEKRERRAVLSGYPRTEPFATEEEIRAYLSQPQIECLLCGKLLLSLSAHLARIHRVSTDDYRARFGLPYQRGMNSAATHKRLKVVREGDSPEVIASRIARIASPQVKAKAKLGPRRDSNPRKLAALSNIAGVTRPPVYDRSEIEAVVARVEAGEFVRDALQGKSLSGLKARLKRYPDLDRRYRAVSRAAQSKAMKGNKLAKAQDAPLEPFPAGAV